MRASGNQSLQLVILHPAVDGEGLEVWKLIEWEGMADINSHLDEAKDSKKVAAATSAGNEKNSKKGKAAGATTAAAVNNSANPLPASPRGSKRISAAQYPDGPRRDSVRTQNSKQDSQGKSKKENLNNNSSIRSIPAKKSKRNLGNDSADSGN